MRKIVELSSTAMAIVAAAALSLGLIVVLASVSPEAKAEIAGAVTASAMPACELQSWPHYDPRCHFDNRQTTGSARLVRVIAY